MAKARPTLIALAGLAIASMTGLTGCSDDPPDAPVLGNDTPSPTAAPTPSTPSPTPPTITPTPGESPTRTLVRQYFALRNHAFQTGEIDPMLGLAADGCQSCQGSAALVRDVFAAGGHLEGDLNERIVEMEGDKERILVVSEQDQWGKVASSGAEPETYPPGQRSADYVLKREGTQWKVAEIRVYQD